jgi:glycosyltransferase involved in cell wall biosynthesis
MCYGSGVVAQPSSQENPPRDLLVIIPAFNEEASLPRVLEGLPRSFGALRVLPLVIDDGSRDRTPEVARAAGATLLSMPFNVGIGAAVQTGFKYARDHGHALAIQFDGDGQHRADQIEALIAPVLAGELDVVIGSRFLHHASDRSSFVRRLGIRLLRSMNSLLTGRTITDSTSGFRAYGRRAIEFLATSYPHDYPEPEAVFLLHRHGFRIAEVPAAMEPRQGGHSSITLPGAVYYMIKVMLAILIEAIRPRMTVK